MRNLTAGNKTNFAIFIFIVLIILLILIMAVSIGLRNVNEKYQITSSAVVYDKNNKYVELENDAQIMKKWTGKYYLEEEDTKKEYELGNFAISYEKTRNSLDLFGTFYQIQKGGNINKITDHNTISNTLDSRFYKIDDRKYLIIAKNISNDTGSLSTENYLIVILDKLGNALLLNDKINVKIIKETIINTNEFDFDVSNETLKFDNEYINLKKIIGSTNEYVPSEEPIDEEDTDKENEEEKDKENVEVAQTDTNSGTNNSTTNNNTQNVNNNSSTIVQNNVENNGGYGYSGYGAYDPNNPYYNPYYNDYNNNYINNNNNNNNNNNSNYYGGGSSYKQDNSWVESLNNWINDVANGFQNIYNGSKDKKDTSTLNKSIELNSIIANTTSLDINYTINDPENKYNVVYAIVSNGADVRSISLDKNVSTYRVTDLNPNTVYNIQIGYKIIFSDTSIQEEILDTMVVKTGSPVESLEITKISLDKIYYTLKLDADYAYDAGCKLKIYVNNENSSEVILTDRMIEKAASSGYTGSIAIPDAYKITGSSLTIKLENTKHEGKDVNVNLSTKIVNY